MEIPYRLKQATGNGAYRAEEASSLRWDELVKMWCLVTHIGEGCPMPPVFTLVLLL